MKKRLLIVAVATTTALCGAFGFAACGDEFQPEVKSLDYTLSEDQSYYIVSGKGNYLHDSELVIPDEYNGLPVKAIGEMAFQYWSFIESITIPEGVVSIGERAFMECKKLSHISVPDSVTTVGTGIFFGCNALQYNEFTDEYGNAVYLGNDTNPYVLLVKAKDKEITSCKINENTRIIYEQAFMSCSELTDISIPDGIVEIGTLAFQGCFHMRSVNIPDSVTTICQAAFSECSYLESLTIPDSVTYIGDSAFGNCEYVTSLHIPKSVTYIGDFAFGGWKSVTSITVDTDNNFYYSQDNCLIEKGSRKLVLGGNNSILPEDITEIGSGAFTGCTWESFTVPDGVTAIGNYAFQSSYGLQSLILPAGITYIGRSIITNCYRVEITFKGTMAQWNAIEKDEYWDNNSNILPIHCTDGDVEH